MQDKAGTLPSSLALGATHCFPSGFRNGLKMVNDALEFMLCCPKLILAIGAKMISLLKVFLDPSLRASPGPSGAVWWVTNDRSLAPLVNNGGGGDDGSDADFDGGDDGGGGDDGSDWDFDAGGDDGDFDGADGGDFDGAGGGGDGGRGDLDGGVH